MNNTPLQKEKKDYKEIWKNLPDESQDDPFIIKVSYADILSRPLFYPVNKVAYGMAILTRRKTFTIKEIEHLRALGFTVQIEVRKIILPEA